MSGICERCIGIVSQLTVFGLLIPGTKQVTVMTKTCDEYEWLGNMRELRELVNTPVRSRKPVYRGVIDLITLPSEDV